MSSSSASVFRTLLVLTAALVLAPLATAAQEMSEGNLAQLVVITARDGHGYEFEEGLKRHTKVAAEQGSPDAWFVWEVMTGENTGSYVAGTFGHTWADFDEAPADPQMAQMSFRNNVQPHVAHAQVAFWTFREDLSRGSPSEEGPTPFIQVYHYMPRFDQAQTVESAFTRVKEAADEAMWPGGDWMIYQLVNGGQHPHYAVVIPGESFADFAEPSPTMYEMLVDQMGEDDATALFQEFAAAMAGETSEMLSYREDLSYIPGDEGM